MIFPTFFNLSLNLAIRSSWSEPHSAPSLVFSDCLELLYLWLQRIDYQSDFNIDLLVSMCKVFSCVVGRGCLLWLVRSLRKTLLPFPLLHFVFQGQICLYSRCFLTSYFYIAVPRHHIKKQRHYFVNNGPSSKGYGFSSGHVWMWELAYKESWEPKNWCFWTVVLERTLESPLNARRSNLSILKEISPGYSLEGLMLRLKL